MQYQGIRDLHKRGRGGLCHYCAHVLKEEMGINALKEDVSIYELIAKKNMANSIKLKNIECKSGTHLHREVSVRSPETVTLEPGAEGYVNVKLVKGM